MSYVPILDMTQFIPLTCVRELIKKILTLILIYTTIYRKSIKIRSGRVYLC